MMSSPDPHGGPELQSSYSREVSSGDRAPLDLPCDRARSLVPSFRRGVASCELEGETVRALERMAAEEGTSLFAVLVGAYASLLSRYSGRSDIRIGAPCTGVNRDAGSEPSTFDNIVVLRIDVSPHLSVRELTRRAAVGVEAAASDRDYSFASLARSAGGFGQPPLLQTMFVANGIATGLTNDPLDHWRPPGPLAVHVARCDIVVTVSRKGAATTVDFEYDAALFDEGTARRMLGHYAMLLAGMASDAAARVASLSLLAPAEREELLVSWNDTTLAVREDACVHEMVEEQVARTPDAIAIVAQNESLTYAELNRRANRLAHHLVSRGVGPDKLVGIQLDRSADMLVAALATLKAGGAYLPLDPAYPAGRIAYMIEDSGVSVVVTRSQLAGVSALPGGAERVMLDVHGDNLAAESDRNLDHRAAPTDLAYVIYTSGSTGQPKGVMVEHRNVVNFCAAMDDRIGTDPGVWLSVTSLSFDISALELFWTLTRGFTVVLYNPEIAAGPRPEMGAVEAAEAAPGGAPPMEFGLFYFASDEGEYSREAGRERYRLLLDGARYADEHGFSAVWTPERHFHAFGGLFPNPALTSAAIAVITERVQIRAGSCVLPLNDPIRVAEAWSLVDNLSNGRVGVSFASGWQPQDFVFAPQSYRERHDVMFRGIETVRSLWRGGTMTMPGGHGKDVTFGIRPSPVQSELPVWITAGGTPETFRKAGELGASLLTHLLGQSIDELTEKLAIYRSAWREHGHGPGDGHVTLMLHTFVGEDEESVRAEVRGPLTRYLRGSVSLFTPFAAALGLDMNNLSEADIDALADHAFTRYYETSGLFGTPESCVAMVDRLRAIGVDELACLIDFGIPSATVLAHLPYLDEVRRLSATRSAARVHAGYSIPELINRHGVTHMQCTPSLVGMLVADEESAKSLRSLEHLFVGGEAFPAALADGLYRLMPGARIMNMYGPTETTIWSTTHTLQPGSATVPIGRPIANTRLYILDEAANPAPVGVTGELLIGGRGVVRGYLGRPELTAQRFVQNPLGAPGDILYRTGDLARYRSDGSVEFVGRVDQQVKLRGHRIELGEIEAVLRRHPAVREAAVVLREDAVGDPRITAYVVDGGATPASIDELRRFLRARLPDVMVPAAWVTLDALPLTPNGKIDRKALPVPSAAGPHRSAEYVPPRDSVEATIEEIWRDVLKLERIGMHDNFFDLGGHSILAIHVLNRVRTRFDRELSMTDVFNFPTIRGLADHMRAAEETGALL